MSNFIEIVFEDLSDEIASEFLFDIISSDSCDVKNVIDLEEYVELNWKTIDATRASIRKLDKSAISINIKSITYDSTVIENVAFTIIKYGSVEVSVLFNSDDVKCIGRKSEAIFQFSCYLAKKYNMKTFYSGIEPAIDLSTRLFTNDVLGPIKF